MRRYIQIVFFVVLGCASQKHKEIFIETIPDQLLNDDNRFDLDNKIYLVDREILYKCSVKRKNEVLNLNLKFIRMTVKGTKTFSNYDPDYNQTVIKYEYLDENYNRIIGERTGLIENNKNIWLHPPRNADLDVLQLSAFPYIKFGAIKNWEWTLHASYANYQDVDLIHRYEKGKAIEFKSHIGVLSCIPIQAITESHFGTTTSEFFYNETYGFVKLDFHTIEGTTITLEVMKS
jgi:hypothetical protein